MLSEIEYRDLEKAWTCQDRRRVLQEINSSLHRAFNLINCKIRIDKGQYQLCNKGISQATVILVPRPTLRTAAVGGEVRRWELRKSISVLPMMNYRGLGLMQTSGNRQNLLWVLNHSFPRALNLITCKFDLMSNQCSLLGRNIRQYLTGDWHGYVCCTDGRTWSYQGGWGRAETSYIDAGTIRRFRYWRE